MRQEGTRRAQSGGPCLATQAKTAPIPLGRRSAAVCEGMCLGVGLGVRLPPALPLGAVCLTYQPFCEGRFSQLAVEAGIHWSP